MVTSKQSSRYGPTTSQPMSICKGLLFVTSIVTVFATPVVSDKDDVSILPHSLTNLDSTSPEVERQRRSSIIDSGSDVWYDEPIDDEKRAKYFLGKRSNRYFLGKRLRNNFLGKRFDSDYESANGGDKRAKYFLGKRDDDSAMDEWQKRAKYFLGKRSEGDLQDEGLNDEENQPLLGKRARYFLGKRESLLADEDYSSLLKRAKYFLGKRAKYFLGKRSSSSPDNYTVPSDLNLLDEKRAKFFLGKKRSDSIDTMDKRQKYFLG
nr:FLamide [Urechis unicinctus]